MKGSVVFGGEKGPTAATEMGLGWVPKNLDETLIDKVYLVETHYCFMVSRYIAKNYGALLGGSSGASLFVAIREAIKLGRGKSVLAVATDRGEKYLEEFYNDNWMENKEFSTNDNLEAIYEGARSLKLFKSPRS